MNSLSDGLLEEKSTMSSAPLCCGPGYSSPTEAMKAPREKLLYTIAIYVGTGVQKPDYLATIDADPASPTYSQVISRCEMPGTGDELHHMGWNACSSCHGDDSMERRFLIVPGVRSSNLHIIDCATDPRNPKLHMVISGQEIKEKTNLSAPHTVHCLGSEIIISMLGDAKGNAPGGFLHLNKDFEILGRWENDLGGMKFTYEILKIRRWKTPSILVRTGWCHWKFGSITIRIPHMDLLVRPCRPTLSTGTRRTTTGLSRRSSMWKMKSTLNGRSPYPV